MLELLNTEKMKKAGMQQRMTFLASGFAEKARNDSNSFVLTLQEKIQSGLLGLTAFSSVCLRPNNH